MSLRLERFELRAFGPFTGTELELGGVAGGGLHIICGPNEVGKSSAQRGIGDFLFGIAPRSTDNHVHAYGDMRVAAVLIDEHGRRHELVRRKGTRSTLLGADQQPIDDGLLDGMLGGMTREAFESMFSITHESLVVGGKALLAADGNVGESLFSASLGAAGLHALRVQLDEQASALFRPRASSTAVVQARAALDAAHAELREQTLRATTFTEHERQVRAADTDRRALVVEIGRARTAQNGRERLRNVIPLLATRARAVKELKAIADAPQLPIDASERRLIAAEREVAGRDKVRDAQARVEQLEAANRRDRARHDAPWARAGDQGSSWPVGQPPRGRWRPRPSDDQARRCDAPGAPSPRTGAPRSGARRRERAAADERAASSSRTRAAAPARN